MKKRTLRQIITYGMLLLLVVSIAACGKNTQGNKGDSQTEESSQNSEIASSDLFLIVENNMLEEALTLYSYSTGLEHYYDYSFSTQFKDKHGNFTPAAEFTAGRVVTIGERDREGYLKEIQLSDEVWEYKKIRRFSIDEVKGILTIADTRYSIRDKVYAFSNGNQIPLADISKEEDILTVVGKEKKILSVVVTTGHGTLALRNTTLFEGSFLQLNNDIFALISDSMEMELPEGKYTLKVANDGWGGTTEIEIVRGETIEIDLDTLKGEGKKKGIVRFEIDVENVEVFIDDVKIDHTQPVEVTYGTHILQIKAEGYDTWKKHLFVNSEDATISIELTKTEEKETETEEEDTEKETEKPEKETQKPEKETEKKEPETEKKEPETEKKEPETEKKEPETEKKEPETEKKEPETEKKEPETEKKEPETEKKEPETEKKEPETEKKEPETEKKEPETEKKEPETEKNESETEKNETP
ncbi:MAG: hypothetical protein IJO60_01430 [Agathobacter sp.]|nr:hypothetical protein [Agathobacter sp.]